MRLSLNLEIFICKHFTKTSRYSLLARTAELLQKNVLSKRTVNTMIPVQTLLTVSPSASVFLPMLHTCTSMTTLYTARQKQTLALLPFFFPQYTLKN